MPDVFLTTICLCDLAALTQQGQIDCASHSLCHPILIYKLYNNMGECCLGYGGGSLAKTFTLCFKLGGSVTLLKQRSSVFV